LPFAGTVVVVEAAVDDDVLADEAADPEHGALLAGGLRGIRAAATLAGAGDAAALPAWVATVVVVVGAVVVVVAPGAVVVVDPLEPDTEVLGLPPRVVRAAITRATATTAATTAPRLRFRRRCWARRSCACLAWR
jgi:hypothetical protein